MQTEQNSKKKNLLISVLSVVLAATLLFGGGTYAYLQGTTDEVVNDFQTNKVLVDLEETTGGDYNIVPGTSEAKDPTVKVNATVPAYVYVTVNDTTEGLVSYEIADGWTLLDGYDNVYYREVEGSDTQQEFPVLKDNTVYYDAALENSDMLDADGNLKEGIQLTFTASAIQKEPFADAAAAFAAKDSAFIETADELTAALAADTPIVLGSDIAVSVDATTVQQFAGSAINLNGKTLTVSGATSGIVLRGAEMTLENGTFVWDGNAPTAVALTAGGQLNLNNVTLNTNATINVEAGAQPATVNIVDSAIYSSDYYCVSTNANNNATGETVEINIVNSTLEIVNGGPDKNGDNTGILFNIPGTLNITNSTVKSDRQAVIVRCGTATIQDSTLTTTATCPADWFGKYDDTTWGSGNEVPVACLVVGNRSNPNSYPHDATCTLLNTTLNVPAESGRPEIYAAAYNGHTTTITSDNWGLEIRTAEGDLTFESDDNGNMVGVLTPVQA